MPTAHEYAGLLGAWIDAPLNRKNLTAARAAFDALAEELVRQPGIRDELAPSLLNVFLRTGYLKDYKLLKRFARRVNRPELLDEVNAVVRAELPDVWVIEALQRGATEAAVECWFENEDHERARLAADSLVKACPGRVDILISGRLSVVAYQIGRSGRSRYRKAIRVLERLHRELDRAGELPMWRVVLDDVLAQHGHRPALLDELQKAGVG